MSTLTATTSTGKALVWFWDVIDISENMQRVERWARRTPREKWAAGMIAVVMFILSLVALILAYVFDFRATYDGMSSLQKYVIENLPAASFEITTILIIAFTITPTLIEVFTGSLAREDVKIVQYAVIAMCIFDVVTDIPRASVFVNMLQPQFDQLGFFAGVGKGAFFIIWLFLSTFGWELLTVIFFYAFLLFGSLATGWGFSTSSQRAYNSPVNVNSKNNKNQRNDQDINLADLINRSKQES